MARIDWSNFLNQLCAWVAAQASLQYAGTPRQLWQGSADEGSSADPYTVLRVAGGSVPWVPTPRVTIQGMTKGKNVADAMAQAAEVYGVLVDASGQPLRMVTIAAPGGGNAGVRANGIDPGPPPSLVGRDADRGRANVVFNWDMRLAAI